MSTKNPQNEKQEFPNPPTLALCAMYQLLANIRCTESSIMPTKRGNYALVIRRSGTVSVDYDDLAIVARRSDFIFGHVANDASAEGVVKVKTIMQMGWSIDDMLAELLVFAADKYESAGPKAEKLQENPQNARFFARIQIAGNCGNFRWIAGN